MQLKQQAVLFRAGHAQRAARNRTDAAQHPVREVRRPQVPRSAHVKDVLAVLRWAQNPRDRVAGFRAIQLLPGVGPKRPAASAEPQCRSARLRAARLPCRCRAERATGLAFVALVDGLAFPRRRLAGRSEKVRPGTNRISNASTRTTRVRSPTSSSSSASPPPTPRANASSPN
jgi:hypothetical protein